MSSNQINAMITSSTVAAAVIAPSIAPSMAKTDDYTMFCVAAKNNDIDTMQSIYDKSDDNFKHSIINEYFDENYNTPLTYAVKNNNINATRLLLNLGADPNHRAYGITPPISLAIQNNNIEIVKLLIEHGARDCLSFYNDEMKYINIEIMKLLFEKEGLQTSRDIIYTTLDAINCNRADIVKLIIELFPNFDLFESDDEGQIPIYTAIKNRQFDIAQLLLDHMKQQ